MLYFILFLQTMRSKFKMTNMIGIFLRNFINTAHASFMVESTLRELICSLTYNHKKDSFLASDFKLTNQLCPILMFCESNVWKNHFVAWP